MDQPEVGYNTLLTYFTGTSAAHISGSDTFPIILDDSGVAMTLSDGELQISVYIGYLYIIVNESFPGWVKVGTTGNLKKRLQTYQTASPFRNYRLVYSIEHPEYRVAERRILETIEPFAKDIKGEWYKIDLEMCKSRLDEVRDCSWGEPLIK